MDGWKIGKTHIPTMDANYLEENFDGDPRGILWAYEEPKLNADYVVGVDPTLGLSSWTRYSRTRDDVDTDNGAIEVIRVGKPDVQVAEYAAPINALDLAEAAKIKRPSSSLRRMAQVSPRSRSFIGASTTPTSGAGRTLVR